MVNRILLPLVWLGVAGLLFRPDSLRASEASTNLLGNGSFEDDQNGDGKPDRWFTYPKSLEVSVDPSITLVSGSGEAAAGDKFVQISRVDGTQSLALTQIMREEAIALIAANPEKTLVLKGKIRVNSEEGAKANLNVQMLGQPKGGGARQFAGRVSTPEVTSPGAWQDVVISFKPADVISPNTDVDHIEVNCQVLSSQGNVDFDDVSLVAE